MILTSRAIYLPIEPPGELVRRKLAKYVDYGLIIIRAVILRWREGGDG